MHQQIHTRPSRAHKSGIKSFMAAAVRVPSPHITPVQPTPMPSTRVATAHGRYQNSAMPSLSCTAHSSQMQSRWRRCEVAAALPPQAQEMHQDSDVSPDLEAAADKLAAFCEVLQGEGEKLTDAQLAELLGRVPDLMEEEPKAVRTKLDAICAGAGLGLGQAAELITRVPVAWNRSAEALCTRLAGLAKDLGVSSLEAAALYVAVPPLFGVNTFSILKDKFDILATHLGVPTSTAVQLVCRQPIVWSIPPRQIVSGVPRLCSCLGLTTSDAVDLIARVPVVLVLEERLLKLQVGALSSTMGVPVSWFSELLGRSLGLVSVPAEVLGSNLANLASSLDVKEEHIMQLIIEQPSMLTAQVASMSAGLDAIEGSLRVSRPEALQVLIQAPGLMFDTTITTITDRMDNLAALFQVSVSDIRALAAAQPLLLLLAPYTLRNGMLALESDSPGRLSPQQCLTLLIRDPGSFLSMSYSDDQVSQWTQRLGLDKDSVSALLSSQPALMEMAATTVKARLESLSALFGIPTNIVAQLVARHPALISIPPNVVITRVKSLSMALGISMQTAGVLVAKSPAVLACAFALPGEVNKDLQPYTDMVQEVAAAYEFYTMEWLQRSLKEAVPVKTRSFSTLDRQ